MIEKIIITVNVKPNKAKFKVYKKEDKIIAEIPEKAEKGKANKELIRMFEKKLKCKARILKGIKSKQKTIELEGKNIKRMFYEQIRKN